METVLVIVAVALYCTLPFAFRACAVRFLDTCIRAWKDMGRGG